MFMGCIQNFLSPLLPLSPGGLIADRLSGKGDPYNLVLCPGSIQPPQLLPGQKHQSTGYPHNFHSANKEVAEVAGGSGSRAKGDCYGREQSQQFSV